MANLAVAVELVGKDSLTPVVNKAKGGMSSFVSSLGGVGLAGLGLQTVFGTITSAVSGFMADAVSAEKVSAQLDAVLKSTGGAAGMTREAVNGLADSLSKVTPFEDEAIISAQSLLLTFTSVGQDVFPQATETILDMSQALGQDLKSSTIQIGKALNDPIKGIGALSRVGVAFTQDQKDMIKEMVNMGDVAGAQGIILAELSKEFGGAAKAAGQTFEGSLTIAQTAVGNIKEAIAGPLINALKDLVIQFTPVIQAFAEYLPGAIEKTIEMMTPFVAFIGEHIGPIMSGLAALILTVVIPAFVAWAVAAVASAAATVVALAPVILVAGAVAIAVGLLKAAWDTNFGDIQGKTEFVINQILVPAFQVVVDWFTRLKDDVTTLKNVFTLAWQELSKAITQAWTELSTAATKSWGEITGAVGTSWAEIDRATRSTVDGIAAFLSSSWDTIKRVAGEAWEGIKNAIWDPIKNLANMVGDLVNEINKKLGGIKVPEIKVPLPGGAQIGIGGGAPIVGGDAPASVLAGIQRGMSFIGSQAWNGLCEKFIGDLLGSRRYPTAWADALANRTNMGGIAPIGQLVFFRPDASNQNAGHVGISLGGGNFLSATAAGVRVDNLANSYWNSLYAGFGPPGFAKGVRGFGGGMAVVGEQGWELVGLPRGSNVYSHQESKAMLGGGDIHVHFHAPVYGFDDFETAVVSATERAGRRGRNV